MAFVITRSDVIQGFNTPADVIFVLIRDLVAGGWEVIGSGDGLLLYSSSGNIISQSGTGAGGINYKTWWRLRQPTGGDAPYAGVREMTFSRDVADYIWRVKYSRAAGFVGGSPGPDQTPSAADEVVLCGGGTDAAPTGTAAFPNSLNLVSYTVIGDADSNFGWVQLVLPPAPRTTSSSNKGLIFFDPLIDIAATEADPFVFCMQGTSYTANLDLVGAKPPTNKNIPSTIFFGGTADEAWANISYQPIGNTSRNVWPLNSGVDRLRNAEGLTPMFAVNAASDNLPVSLKGRSSLFRWAATNRVDMTLFELDVPGDYIKLGDVALPWDGTRFM